MNVKRQKSPEKEEKSVLVTRGRKKNERGKVRRRNIGCIGH